MIFIFLIIVWICFSLFVDLGAVFLPTPIGVVKALVECIANGSLLWNLSITLTRVFVSVLIAAGVGVPMGFASAASKNLQRFFMPVVEFARGIPTSMLFPVFIVLIGFGEKAKLAIVLYSTIPVFIIGAFIGASPGPESLGRREYLQLHRKEISFFDYHFSVFWEAIPSLLASMKLAISLALVLVIVTEMFFVANSGVGWAAYHAYNAFSFDEMYAYIFVVGLAGLCINRAFDYFTKKTDMIVENN